jgi:hypothetical protein
MFSLLVHAHQSATLGAPDLLTGAPSTQGLAAYRDSSDEFAGHSMLLNVAPISPELLAKEKDKAKQGYCETALWNCNDLWGP